MNTNMSYIFRSIVISVLMAGFLAHLILPFSSQAQKNAFTQWLNHNVVTSGSETEIKLRNTIRELPEQSRDFWSLVQQASELVATHKDGFRIHFAFTDDEDQPQRVTTWLIGQWNVYQNHKTATNAIIPEIIQPVYKWISANGISSAVLAQNTGDYHRNNSPVSLAKNLFVRSIYLIPLAGGTSINAP
ncbi:MAG: hypothetical protein EA359_09550 [Balneolaceae bacterium]|nr:MAG: hypothetical protein EA359_09550 [Balneolaceae bacterium]